jgi:integrase
MPRCAHLHDLLQQAGPVQSMRTPGPSTCLRAHINQFGFTSDGRLFRGEAGGGLSESVYGRIWDAAGRTALTDVEAQSPLAKRPYDLRHACLSTWLNARVDPTQVADWAGNSVAVLLRVYPQCIAGREDVARQRIEDALPEDGPATRRNAQGNERKPQPEAEPDV